MHGTFLAQTGSPFNPRTGYDRTRLQATGATGDLGQRPNLAIQGTPAILGGPDRYFDPNAFSLPAAGFFGNLGHNTLIGPGLSMLDMSVNKRFRISERMTLQFRTEMFNSLNHANLAIPSARTVFASTGPVGSAGRITSTLTSARQLQLGMKLTF